MWGVVVGLEGGRAGSEPVLLACSQIYAVYVCGKVVT